MAESRAASKKEYLDVISRPLKVGDYVVYYNHIYKILAFNDKRNEVTIFLAKPSPSTKKMYRLSYELTLLPEHDVLLWLLKKNYNDIS